MPRSRITLLTLCLFVFTAIAQAQDLDPSFYYRLTTQWQGDGKSLDIISDAQNNKPILAPSGNTPGQSWKLTPLGNGFYRLSTQGQGEGKSLDIINDGQNNKPILAASGNYSGQMWKLTKLAPVASVVQASASLQGWMEQSAAYIGHKSLNTIAIPQTHDSGTYALISSWLRPTNDVFAPDAERGMVKFGSFSNITEGWAKAQEKTIYQQLTDGMRSLDLRPCVEKNGNLRICHGLYGPTMSEIVKDIRKFADQYPKEIVIIGVGGFSQTKHGDMDATNVQRVKDLINAELGPRLVNHSGINPTSTVNEIWAKNPGKSLIIVFRYPNSGGFWGSDKVTGSWKDTWNIDEKKKSLGDALTTAPPTTLFEFSGPATPNGNCIGLGILAGYPKNGGCLRS